MYNCYCEIPNPKNPPSTCIVDYPVNNKLYSFLECFPQTLDKLDSKIEEDILPILQQKINEKIGNPFSISNPPTQTVFGNHFAGQEIKVNSISNLNTFVLNNPTNIVNSQD